MNKNQFLDKMEGLLANIPKSEREDILYDYEEYFRSGLEEGKTEEEIAEALGKPEVLAQEFINNNGEINIEEEKKLPQYSDNHNMIKSILIAVALGFFNLIFVLGPFMGLVGVVIGFFGAALGITVGGIAVVVTSIVGPISWVSIPFSSTSLIATFFAGVGLTALGLLCFIGLFYLTKFFYYGTKQYIKFNVRLITDGRVKNEL